MFEKSLWHTQVAENHFTKFQDIFSQGPSEFFSDLLAHTFSVMIQSIEEISTEVIMGYPRTRIPFRHTESYHPEAI